MIYLVIPLLTYFHEFFAKQIGKVVNAITRNEHFFRQINIFTKEVTKELISRIFFMHDHVFLELFLSV